MAITPSPSPRIKLISDRAKLANKVTIPSAFFESRHAHLPINATHPIHLMRKVMMESPVETIFSNINNNVDLWIELGYIRVW